MDALRFELNMLEHLETIRLHSAGSSVQTKGWSDDVIQRFCDIDPKLVQISSKIGSKIVNGEWRMVNGSWKGFWDGFGRVPGWGGVENDIFE